METITVSTKNIKLGTIPNISLPPRETCPKDAPCFKDCYAMKAYRNYSPPAKKAWDKNLRIYKADHADYFAQLSGWLSWKKPEYFRWHAGGDCPDAAYCKGIISIAKAHAEIRFLIMSKKYDLWRRYQLPENLAVMYSCWPGYPLPDTNHPVYYMQDGTETRVKNAAQCAGSCITCKVCWHSRELKTNVVNSKH